MTNYMRIFNGIIDYNIAEFAKNLAEKGGNKKRAEEINNCCIRFQKKKDNVLESSDALVNE